jgi:hypothetical protein
MNKETVLENIGSGWHMLIETAYTIQNYLAFSTEVEAVERKNGMLTIKFSRRGLTDKEHEFILDAVEYRLERLSVKVCEGCGQHGIRRTELPTIKSLCTRCYALAYSEFKDSQEER